MKQQTATLGIAIICSCLAVTACGAPNGHALQNLTPGNNSTSNVPSTGSGLHSANTNSTTESAPIQLTKFRGLSQAGIQVEVPQGWVKTSIQGGDYTGWKFTNPADANETEVIVQSTCVGCYLDASGNPNPTQVIPQGDTDVKATKQTPDSVEYQFRQAQNPNQGHGMLITSKDQAGYAYVETMFPASQQAISTEVVSSFSYSL